MEKEKRNLFVNCSFYDTSWENDNFESALSSMVCSPTASNAASNGCNFKELIGRLGSICNAGDTANGGYSTNVSCYSTPLNSPRMISSSAVENQRIRENMQQQIRGGFSGFTSSSLVMDPGSDRGKIYGSPVFGTQKQAGFGDSGENSSLSELTAANPRKRKASAKGKGKETLASASVTAPSYTKREENSSDSEKEHVTRAKHGMDHKQQKEDSSTPEPPKDYIHVRARRGQATDAHSLAERVRREKISERMKILQDLVPGCNKVAGKAVMLDEIINYVQSLQRQVEFLSMKLATINPRIDCNVEATVLKDMCQARGSFHNHSESYSFHSQSGSAVPIPNRMDSHFTSQSLHGVTAIKKQSHAMDTLSETSSRVSMFWEDDLHNFVQMGFREEPQKFPGILPITQMKIEN